MDPEEAARRLIESEQQLAALPEIEDRLERTLAENAALRAELEATRETMKEIARSPSWRLTAPLRHLRRLVRPPRRA